MLGNWETEEFINEWGWEDYYYMNFSTRTNGMSCYFNVPYEDVSYSYWDIIDLEFVFTNSSSKIVSYVYTIEFIDANTIRVYSYSDLNTYILTRD